MRLTQWTDYSLRMLMYCAIHQERPRAPTVGEIRVGDVVRMTETDFNLVECFDADSNSCRIVGSCRLKNVLSDAMSAYLAVLDGVSVADLIGPAGARIELPVVPMPTRGQPVLTAGSV